MKYKHWLPYLLSALVAFVLAVSAVGNLITGYDLPVVLWKICLFGGLAAVASAVLFHFHYDRRVVQGTVALALVGILLKGLFRPQISQQMQHLSYLITSHYHDIYNWPVLGTPGADRVTAPLILWAILVAVCVNWCLCRRKHIVFAIVPTVIPLALCLMTTDKVPATVYLYLLILGLAVLWLTDWTRRKQPEQGVKMLLWSVLPVALSLALLFACNPKEGYVNRAGKFQKDVVAWLEGFRDTTEWIVYGTPIDSSMDKKQNLRTVGPRSKSTRSVMLVNSPIDGMLYLRDRDFDIYTGTGWEASNRKEEFTTGGPSVGTLTIVTYGVRDVLCVPYYATTEIDLVGGAVENEDSIQKYSYELSRVLSKKTDYPDSRYKKLPEETQEWAKNFARKVIAGAETDREKILQIQNYVRNSAIYDTSTSRMDSDYNDFARWFLEESDTGHCVHYATAATVLLRAAGIHARYVEGYIVHCEAGKDVVVNKQDAHAWVEYYDWTAQAWCVLETTPAYPKAERPEIALGKPQEDGTKPGDVGDTPVEDTPTEEIPTEETPTEEIPTEETPTEDTSMDPTSESEETETPDAPVVDTPSQKPGEMPRKNLKWIRYLAAALLFAACVLLQGYVRIFVKRKLWNRGQPNERTIWRWRLSRSDAKLLKQLYPEELDALALKARFSQYEIQPEELQQFEDYRLALLALIAEKPWHQRLVFKWILAIA